MSRVFKSRGGRGPQPGRCCAGLPLTTGLTDTQCSRKEVLHEPDDDGVMRGWCKQHAPSTVKAKREARETKWKVEGERNRGRWEREARLQIARNNAVTLLRLIATGALSIDSAQKGAVAILEELDR